MPENAKKIRRAITNAPPAAAEWLAADWGLSRLRLWAMRGDKSFAAVENDNGAATLTKPAHYENALIKTAAPWLHHPQTPVLICGMAGSRQGWRESPYRFVPCAPLADGSLLAQAPGRDKRIRALLLPGLAQRQPANVMRGEETQIAGLLASMPKFDGAVCLPGSHAKWARVRDGMVRKFDTMMTGELFALLSQHSALRSAVNNAVNNHRGGFDKNAFAEAAEVAMRRPSQVAAMLFALRAESLLRKLPPAKARARLSGLCIGADIAAAASYCRGEVMVIGAKNIGKLYQTALKLRGINAGLIDGNKASLTGLQAMRLSLS